jgi:ADP-ribose pyrophosphatase
VQAVIVGTGLTNRRLGVEHPYPSDADHVGLRESARLLGAGSEAGPGPLPAVLTRAAAADAGLIMVTDAGPGLEDALVEPVAVAAHGAAFLPASGTALPWRAIDELLDTRWPDATAFLVVGSRTEHEVASIATMLRSLRPDASIAVCRHLAATATPDAHFATLRHTLPMQDVDVLLELDEVGTFLGLPTGSFDDFGDGGCPVEPEEICEMLGDTRRRIVKSLSMHWSRTRLRPLGGGFSGSALFIAEGWKGEAHTEPMVVKIDGIEQMRRELDGYHQVKDLLGKHVPAFGYPVRGDGMLGVGMELAAMDGSPQTLQETYEAATTDGEYAVFLRRLERSLDMLGERLYRNTSAGAWVVPYRSFGLHAEEQIRWLRENAEFILGYLGPQDHDMVDVDRLVQLLRVVGSNPDGLDGRVCIVHGDLNYANIISDVGDNLWFIDWTLSRLAPIEMDFAKLENDVKFVISKDFELSELDRLRAFEDYLLAGPLPGDVDELPDSLRYARWDLRYRKILTAVRLIRRACLDLTGGENWLVYRIALLRYAAHTLSWDLRRDRGECDVPQLAYALYSVEALLMDLIVDDFHLKIRAERAAGYPERLRIPIDEAPWDMPCDDYDPPYHVSDTVLASDRTSVEGGWADPEDVSSFGDELARRPADHRDALGRPLNPRGRTGIAGRGSLGRWGANRSASVVPVRRNPASGELDVLLGTADDGRLEIPKGFLHDGEAPEDAAARVIGIETGWGVVPAPEDGFFDGYIYDARQTDHSWIETCAHLLYLEPTERVLEDRPPSAFAEIGWWPLDADTVNRIPAVQAGLVREAVRELARTDRMDADEATELLAATG